jgi:transcriptional regulator of arginine metabolism
VLSGDTAAFLVVLRTLPASAQAAAMAVDSMEWPEIVGTIAGDDTIFVAVRDVNDVNHVAEQFKKFMKM